jgi:hypothetical protein
MRTASGRMLPLLARGSVTFPISHGYVTTPRHNGVLYHEGGVKFANGTRSLALRELVLVRRADETVLTAKVAACG